MLCFRTNRSRMLMLLTSILWQGFVVSDTHKRLGAQNVAPFNNVSSSSEVIATKKPADAGSYVLQRIQTDFDHASVSAIPGGPSRATGRYVIANATTATTDMSASARSITITGKPTAPSMSGSCTIVMATYTLWPGPYTDVETDYVVCPSPDITAMPKKINATATLPTGYGVYQNTSFATSCAFDDLACYSNCGGMAVQCGSAWSKWTSENSFWEANTKVTAATTTTTSTSQEWSYSPSVASNSDGHTTFYYAYSVGHVASTTTETSTLIFDRPTVVAWTNAPPTCTPSTWEQCIQGPNCDICTVQAGTVQLLYWPEPKTTLTSRYLGTTARRRGSNATGIASLGTGILPTTAMFGTHTLTSPSVYISFQTAYALDDCGKTVGNARTGALLAMDPHSLSSIQAGLDYFVITTNGQTSTFYQSASFDYRDLEGMAPATAYTNQPRCLAIPCYTIYPDYRPQLVLPPQMRSMDPAWKSCAMDWHGAWDPPIPLHAAGTVEPVTTATASSYTMRPSPQSTVSGPATQTEASAMTTSSQGSQGHDTGALATTATAQTGLVDPGSAAGHTDQSAQSSTTTSMSTVAYFSSGLLNSALLSLSTIKATTTFQISQSIDRPQTETSGGGMNLADPRSSVGLSTPAIANSIAGTSGGHEFTYDPSSGFHGLASTASLNAVETSSPDPSTGDDGEHLSSPQTASAGGLESDSNTSLTALVILSKTVFAAGSNSLIVAGTLISVGGKPVTISSVVYSAASGAGLVVVSNVLALASPVTPTNAYEVLSAALPHTTATSIATVMGSDRRLHTIVPVSGGFAVDDGTTIEPGQAATISGLGYISAGTNGEIYEEASHGTRPSATAEPVVTGAGRTLGPGNGDMTVDGHTLSAAPHGIVEGGSTITVPGLSSSVQVQAVITMGSIVATAIEASEPGDVQIHNQTLSVGGSALVSAGHTFSAVLGGIAEDGTVVTFHTLTVSLPYAAVSGSTAQSSLPAVVTVSEGDGATSATANTADASSSSSSAAAIWVCKKMWIVVALALTWSIH